MAAPYQQGHYQGPPYQGQSEAPPGQYGQSQTVIDNMRVLGSNQGPPRYVQTQGPPGHYQHSQTIVGGGRPQTYHQLPPHHGQPQGPAGNYGKSQTVIGRQAQPQGTPYQHGLTQAKMDQGQPQDPPPPYQPPGQAPPPPLAVYQLAPLSRPVGVMQQWTAQQTVTLVLKEKIMSWSGDDFYIRDISGQDVFRVQGTVMSLSGRKELSDAAGNHLFTIRKEPLSFLKQYYAEGPSGKRFLEVHAKLSFGSHKFEINFIDTATKQRIDLTMKENLFDTRAEIKLGEQVIVSIDRRILNARDFFANKDTYAVTVAPGFDMTCAIAMCIALDEARHDK